MRKKPQAFLTNLLGRFQPLTYKGSIGIQDECILQYDKGTLHSLYILKIKYTVFLIKEEDKIREINQSRINHHTFREDITASGLNTVTITSWKFLEFLAYQSKDIFLLEISKFKT